MSIRLPYLGLPALILTLATSAACDGSNSSVTAPAAGGPDLNAFLAAEPETLRPEPLPGRCSTIPGFSTRVGVIVRGRHDVILRHLRFRFIERTGATVFPEVFATNVSAPLPESSIPTSSPIPFPTPTTLPGSSPIPIPGSLPIQGILVGSGSSRTFPFFLRFGCGVLDDGTLVIVADATDANGRSTPSELRVRVAR